MKQTIPQMVFARVDRFRQYPAMRRKVDGIYRSISWDELAEQVDYYAAGLLALGLQPEDQVAILAPNCPEWVFADLAIMSLQARTVPVYHTEGIKTILHILADSGSRMLFTHSSLQAQEILSHREQCPALKIIILLEGESDKAGIYSLNRFLQHASESRRLQVARIRQQGDGEQLATLVYTSGTTGPPKGAMLTHDNILCNIEDCCSRFNIGFGDQCLSFLPLSHIFERTTGYYLMLQQGATIAYAESIDTVAANLTEVRPTALISVPRLYEKMHNRVLERVTTGPWLNKQLFFFAMLLGRAKVRRDQKGLRGSPLLNLAVNIFDRLVFRKIKARLGGRLRILISGGAPLSHEIAEFFLAAGVPIYQGYGMTETAPVIAVNYPQQNRLGSVGPPLPRVELKIAADGELLVSGRSIFKGYWQREEENAILLQEGWFHTGDLASLDDDGFLHITGRKKELIVTAGGKNVAPQELENELKTDKFISNVMIYGDNKPYLVALIVPDFVSLQKYANYKHLDVLDQRNLLNDPQALDLIRRRILSLQQQRPSYQQIKRFTLLARDFSSDKGEVTQTLKLKRKVIAGNYAQVIEDLYRTSSEVIHKTSFCSLDQGRK